MATRHPIDAIPRAKEALAVCEEMRSNLANVISKHTGLMVRARKTWAQVADMAYWQTAAGRPALEDTCERAKQSIVDVYETGEPAPFSGMFVVQSQQHPLPRVVMLREGDPFPGCSRCAEVLSFWVLARHDLPGNLKTWIDKLPVIDRR